MTTWSKDELRKIADADDLHISPFREDGVTYGTPTWIWSVAVDDAFYVRGYNGQNSRWYQKSRCSKSAGSAKPEVNLAAYSGVTEAQEVAGSITLGVKSAPTVSKGTAAGKFLDSDF